MTRYTTYNGTTFKYVLKDSILKVYAGKNKNSKQIEELKITFRIPLFIIKILAKILFALHFVDDVLDQTTEEIEEIIGNKK